ncbi:helix-turn-helix domain-containing protein [Streptomyces cadmiisoli]|uniref:helix-turn-helix domain-containing protein n=1 Tax=Streptomyces cadmiisoli TaxID=2184053 RepID=UPI003646A005
MTDEEFFPDEIRAGRRSRYRFTQTPQWALLWTDVSDAAYRAYSLLLAHLNAERGDGLVWPTQANLATMLGKHPNSVSRVITKELARLGLVDVEKIPYGPNKMRRRNVYTVHEEPPTDWTGWASIREFYAANRPAQAAAAGGPGSNTNGESEVTTDGESEVTKIGVGNYTKPELDKEQQREAPSARSAGDARRATAGSGVREAASGSAATSKTPRPKTTKRLTGAQVAAVAQVEAALPRSLVALLPYSQLPTSIRHVVARELDARTVEQLIARVTRRWDAHRYADAVLSEEGPGVRRAVGIATALVRAGECSDPVCEDGRMVDSGADCRACPERKADRRNGKAPVPGQRPAAPAWVCVLCQAPGKGEAPADLECRRCRTDADAACAALQARLDAEMDHTPAEPAAAPQGPAEAPQQPEPEQTRQTETDQERADRKELERLRAEIAAAHPGLADIAAKANH